MSLALLLASLLSGIIQGIPSVSSTIKQTIAGIVAGASAVVSSGVTTTLTQQTFFAALAGVIAALKAEPNIPQTMLADISALEDALAAAVAADKVAQAGVNPAQIKPVQVLP